MALSLGPRASRPLTSAKRVKNAEANDGKISAPDGASAGETPAVPVSNETGETLFIQGEEARKKR